MQEFINNIVIYLQNLISNSPYVLSITVAMLVIVLDSIIPPLPLGLFIALNIHLFGNILGFFMSWIATIIGCFLSFYIVRKLFDKKLEKKAEENEKIDNIRKKINRLSFSNLVLLITLPFTPAFAINIAAGLSKMKFKKFSIAIIIGKIFTVIFWGYIGTSLIRSITDIWVIIKILVMLIIAFVISKIVMKKFNME